MRRSIVRATRRPRVGQVDWGDLRSLEPVSRDWGFDRGTPIDRYYIERFVRSHSADIQGRVLEIADNRYTRQFGGGRVTRGDVMHPVEGNPRATIVADLARSDQLDEELFDCVICTQTLQLIFDVNAAVNTLYRILKPGGVLLLTVPGITQISREDMESTGDCWRFTTASVERLLVSAFSPGNCEVRVHGSVLTSVAFLEGIAAEELSSDELEAQDGQFQLLLTARAVR